MKKFRRSRGQVTAEFVIMLAFVLLIYFSMKYLGSAMCDQGERMVKIAAFNVP